MDRSRDNFSATLHGIRRFSFNFAKRVKEALIGRLILGKAELPALKTSIDPKIDLVVNFDRSITIRASLRQVEETLILAVAMVILVVAGRM